MKDEINLFVMVICLTIVQAILVPGPLRENVEIWVFLQFFPGLDFIIQIGNLASSTETGSAIFYIKLGIILIQDVITFWFYLKIKEPVFQKVRRLRNKLKKY